MKKHDGTMDGTMDGIMGGIMVMGGTMTQADVMGRVSSSLLFTYYIHTPTFGKHFCGINYNSNRR